MNKFRNIFKGIMISSLALFCGLGLTDNADAAEATSVWIGETELTEGEYLPVNSTEVTTEKPETGYAYFSAGELYLSDYTYTGTDRVYYTDEEGNEYTASIWSADDLVINYEGDNYVTATNPGYSCITASMPEVQISGMVTINAVGEDDYLKVVAAERGHGIYSGRGHIYLNGPGKLEAYAYNGYAVYSTYDVNIINLDGYYNSSSEDDDVDCMSIAAQGDVWLEGTATIESTSGRGIYAQGSVYILASTEGTDRGDVYINSYSDCIFAAGSVYLSGRIDLYTEDGYAVQNVGSIDIMDEEQGGVADTYVYCKSNKYGFVCIGAVTINADLEMDTGMSAIYNGNNVTIQPADKKGKDTVVTIRGGDDTICSQGVLAIKNKIVTDENGNKIVYKPQVSVETTGVNALYAEIDSIILQGDFYSNGSLTAVNKITVGMEETEGISEDFTESIVLQTVDNGLWAANDVLTINKYVSLDADCPAMALSGAGIVIDSDKTVDVHVKKDDAVGSEQGDIIFSGNGNVSITAEKCSAILLWSADGNKLDICGEGKVVLTGGIGLYEENYDAVSMIGNTVFCKSGSGDLTIISNSGYGIGMVFSDSTCDLKIGGTGDVSIVSTGGGIYQENPGTISFESEGIITIVSEEEGINTSSEITIAGSEQVVISSESADAIVGSDVSILGSGSITLSGADGIVADSVSLEGQATLDVYAQGNAIEAGNVQILESVNAELVGASSAIKANGLVNIETDGELVCKVTEEDYSIVVNYEANGADIFVIDGSGNYYIEGISLNGGSAWMSIGQDGIVNIDSVGTSISAESGDIDIMGAGTVCVSSGDTALVAKDIIIADSLVVDIYADQHAMIAENVYIDGGQVDILTQWGHCLVVSGVVEIITGYSVTIDSMDAAYAMVVGSKGVSATQGEIKVYISGENEAYKMNGIYLYSGDVVIGGSNSVSIETGYGNGIMLLDGDLYLDNSNELEIIGVRGINLSDGTVFVTKFGNLIVRAIYTGRYAVKGAIDLSACTVEAKLMAGRTTYPGSFEAWEESENEKYYCIMVEAVESAVSVFDSEEAEDSDVLSEISEDTVENEVADAVVDETNDESMTEVDTDTLNESVTASEGGTKAELKIDSFAEDAMEDEAQADAETVIEVENEVAAEAEEELETENEAALESEKVSAVNVAVTSVTDIAAEEMSMNTTVSGQEDLSVPETGDSFNMLLMVMMLVCSLGCVYTLAVKAKK